MILLPKRELIVPLRLQARVAGWYKLEAVGLDGRVRPLTGWFPNLITNGGLDNLGSGTYPWNHCVVGTGNATPSNTDTQLVAQIADTTNAISRAVSALGTSPYTGSMVTTWQFPVGAATGNLAEVGCGKSATALFSRALILDGGGAPTTITVLSNEALNVSYQVGINPPLSDVPGSVSLGGSSYTTNLRAANAGSAWWQPSNDTAFAGIGSVLSGSAYSTATLGAITAVPAGTAYSIDSSSTATYSVGSYTQSCTFNWSINAGNAPGGVGSVVVQFYWGSDSGFGVNGAGAYQCSFSPVIPKDNTKTLSLVFSVAWARV